MRKLKLLVAIGLGSLLMASIASADWAVVRKGNAPCQIIKVGNERIMNIVAGPFSTRAEAESMMKKATGCRNDTFR